MRDPARIPRILEKLGRLWAVHPDMRLGQLIENVMAVEAGQPVEDGVFDLEDADLEEWIDRWMELLPKPR